MAVGLALRLAETGRLPTGIVRWGMRRLLKQRLDALGGAAEEQAFLAQMRASPIALETQAANRQHYEVPPAFFECVLGPHLKYSSCLWEPGSPDLASAEARMLELTAARARLADGQRILELGCGWGSLTLFAAERLPHASIVAVSNSAPQRTFIEARARARGLTNLRVVTADMNAFDPGARFDRIVSIEMFEHMRNWEALLGRARTWLEDDGRLFLHVFAHKARTYPFENAGQADWMARHFFTGGLMPADDLLERLAIPFRVETHDVVDGRHYAKTARAWRERLEQHQDEVVQLLAQAGAGVEAPRAYGRWRLFFLACEELFGFRDGREWFVSHQLLAPAA